MHRLHAAATDQQRQINEEARDGPRDLALHREARARQRERNRLRRAHFLEAGPLNLDEQELIAEDEIVPGEELIPELDMAA